MAANSQIGWTDHTFNFWWGCTKVSEECRHCYIEAIMKRAGIAAPFGGPIRTKNWSTPLRWHRKAARDRVRRRVFTCSMSDFFHPGADAWRAEAWQLIAECRNLDWLILTKRPEQVSTCLPSDWGGQGYRHVWLGVTCGHSDSYERVSRLIEIPAAVRFVSAEPLLGPLDLRAYLPQIDWVITGCEQAARKKRRVMKLDWVRDIDRQCQQTDTAHFFKQYYQDERGTPCTDGVLDGVVRQDFPRQRQLVVGPRRTRKRKLVDIVKQLLGDCSIVTEGERVRAWQKLTGLSRARYYYYLATALEELGW